TSCTCASCVPCGSRTCTAARKARRHIESEANSCSPKVVVRSDDITDTAPQLTKRGPSKRVSIGTPTERRPELAMPVEIESILQHEDVQIVLEATEASGSVRQSELNDLTEAHEFDVFELDLLYRELETRGIECVDDTREVEKAPPPPPPPPVESTTDALQ